MHVRSQSRSTAPDSERARRPGCRRRPWGGRRCSAFLAVGSALFGVYLVASLVLPRGVDLLRESRSGFFATLTSPAGYSGIFDLDVMRVLQDWTGDTTYPAREPSRTHVHPLSRLAVAPIATALDRAVGGSPLNAVRVVVACSMAVNSLLTGWLALQLAGGALLPGLAAALLYGLSFSSILLGTIPDHGSLSCLSTMVPLVYLTGRLERRFDWQEAITWGFLGVLCLAFTLSQIMHWVIALGVRVFDLRRGGERSAPPEHLAWKLLAAMVILAATTATALALQEHLYPGIRFTPKAIKNEEIFLRLEDLRGRPLAHVARLAVHFVGYSFAAPLPGYSDYLMRNWDRAYWSLSLEAVGLRDLHPLQLLLGAALVGLMVAAALSLKRVDRRFVAPLLSLLGQFVLHLAYGREYILYSPNWHGPLVAILVAAAWRTFETRQRLFAALVLALSTALAVNNLAVLRRVYDEVDFGLERWRRDAVGRRAAAGPWQDRPPARPRESRDAAPPR